MLKRVVSASRTPLWLCLLLGVAIGSLCQQACRADELLQLRPFSATVGEEWIGQGISYGPYRAGQGPGGVKPSAAEIAEDLKLMLPHWKLLRMYGSGKEAETTLRVIRDQKLPMKVMLGAWITREIESETLDAQTAAVARAANEEQVADAIRLANAYPDQVIAVSVGNETQVYWSDHITKLDLLIGYIRQVRQATKVPVTTADDFNFWNKPESKAVAAEIDFIVTHLHAHWAGTLPATAMEWTDRIYSEVCEYHPDKLVAVGEAGWATTVHTEGEQARLIKGEASEKTQAAYYREFTEWAKRKQVCTFYFEAFDESWKGGPHPDEVEKHWGLFFENRTPKAALTNMH